MANIMNWPCSASSCRLATMQSAPAWLGGTGCSSRLTCTPRANTPRPFLSLSLNTPTLFVWSHMGCACLSSYSQLASLIPVVALAGAASTVATAASGLQPPPSKDTLKGMQHGIPPHGAPVSTTSAVIGSVVSLGQAAGAIQQAREAFESVLGSLLVCCVLPVLGPGVSVLGIAFIFIGGPSCVRSTSLIVSS